MSDPKQPTPPPLDDSRLRRSWELATGRVEGTRRRQVPPGGILDTLRSWPLARTLAGTAATLVLILGSVLFLVRPSRIRLQTPEVWAETDALPRDLLLKIASSTVALTTDAAQAFSLGSRVRAADGDPSLTIHDASFSTTNSAGLPVRFSGRLILTNSPGTLNIRGRRDMVGALLIGEIAVGGGPPKPFQQPYGIR